MKRIWRLFFILTLALAWIPPQHADAGPYFRAVQSGRWDDPATWGMQGAPQPDETIPGPLSDAYIADDVVVTLGDTPVEVASLTVAARGTLLSTTGADLTLSATRNIIVDGSVLGGSGDATHGGGNVILISREGKVVNRGLIRGGDAGLQGGPGGGVRIESAQSDLENWGNIHGGRGVGAFPGGWVELLGRRIVRQMGEIRGGSSDRGPGGNVLVVADATVDMRRGRILGGTGTPYGDVAIHSSAVLAEWRSTRLSGEGVSVSVDSYGYMEFAALETAAVLARSRGLWIVGREGTWLNLQGNHLRFSPLQVIGGTAHVWVDTDHIDLDADDTLRDLVSGPLDAGPSRSVAVPHLALADWEPLRRGQDVSWHLTLTNAGTDPTSFSLTATTNSGWPVTVTPAQTPSLPVGTLYPVTLTVHVPITATFTPTATVSVRVSPLSISGPATQVDIPLRPYAPVHHFPWLGYRAAAVSTPADRDMGAEGPVLTFSWPGADQGQPIQGPTLLLFATDLTDIIAGDLSYWDGGRWVPMATLSDMENLTEDHVWVFPWDPSRIFAEDIHVRARVWTADGQVYQVIRRVPLEHPPYADATASWEGNGTVLLDASRSTDFEGPIATYAWDFGDGQTGEGRSVRHTYLPGTYVVRLTVTDTAGLSDEEVYVLDAEHQTWKRQTACGCQSMRLLTSGPSPLPLPWQDEDTAVLGPSYEVLTEDLLVRANLAVDVTLTPDSNAEECKMVQEGRVTWSWNTPNGPQTRSWMWGGQTFPYEDATAWGMMGYTDASALLSRRGQYIRWVEGTGWGWKTFDRGLPPSALEGNGVRLEGVYRARVAGSEGTCTCTWQVKIRAVAGGTPTVHIIQNCGP